MIEKILFNSFDDLKYWLRKAVENETRTCPEDYEEKFGVLFGTEEERMNGINNMDIITVDEPEELPKQYPCLMLYCDDNGWDRLGKFRVSFKEYIYLDDFKGE